MPRAVFEKAARGLLRAFPGVKLVKFFGGEPLLNFALVRFGVSYLRSLGFSSAFEVGTNGLLLDGARLAYFRARPEIQLNVNASFGVKKAFLGLPNLIWNLCVLPDAQGEAVALLRRIAGLSKRARPRVNLLPAYYRDWSPAQLGALKRTARDLAACVRQNGLVLENAVRTGSAPLFNDGPAVDVDGKIYGSNLCLAAMPGRLRDRLLLRGPLPSSGGGAVVSKKDLVAVFGLRAVAASFAADSIMGDGLYA